MNKQTLGQKNFIFHVYTVGGFFLLGTKKCSYKYNMRISNLTLHIKISSGFEKSQHKL